MKKLLYLVATATIVMMSVSACSGNDDERTEQDVPDTAKAQYLPLLCEGRVWNSMFVSRNEEGYDTVYYSLRVEGTTVVDGHSCYSIRSSVGDVVGYYYQDGPKVYYHDDVNPEISASKDWLLLYDFSISMGEKMRFDMVEASAVDTISVKGVNRRRISFGDEYIIEGIGSTRWSIFYHIPVIYTFHSSKLLTVYDGDKCIYDWKDISTKYKHEAINLSCSDVKLSLEPKSSLARVKVNIRYDLNLDTDMSGKYFDKNRIYVRSVRFSGITFTDGRKDGNEGCIDGSQDDEPNQYLNPTVTENYAPMSNEEFGSAKSPGITDVEKLLFALNRNDADDGYFYVVPRGQKQGVDLDMTYYRETIDPRLSVLLSDGETHGMLVESTLSKKDLLGQNVDFEAGKSYVINIVLGSEKPKMEVFVSDWQ
jgi:hypothetical protein